MKYKGVYSATYRAGGALCLNGGSRIETKKVDMRVIVLFLLLTNLAAAAQSEFTPYIVKKGETVSEILHNHQIAPLYTGAEWVEKVLKLNRLTQETAKKLEPGEVIILPVSSLYFSPDEIATEFIPKDEFSKKLANLKSEITSDIFNQKVKEGRHNFTILGEYFYRDSQLNRGGEVQLGQNIGLEFDYLYRDPTTGRRITWNPQFSAAVVFQGGAEFAERPDLGAEFSPSVRLRGGAQAEIREWGARFTPFAEYEYFSYVDATGPGRYLVRKDSILWGGVNFEKSYDVGQFRLFGGWQFAGSLAAANKKGISVGNEMNGRKIKLHGGFYFQRNYRLEAYWETQDLTAIDTMTINSVGLKVGYRF